MPTFETAAYAAQKPTRSNPSRLATQNTASGDVEFALIPYNLDGTEAAADIINLCVLPADAIPLPQLSSIVCLDDPGTALTLDIGTAANTDGWGDAVALTAVAQVAMTSGTMPAWVAPTPLVADTGFATAGSAVVYATVTVATSLNADAALYFLLAYKRAK